jgi:hypothetical protein
MADELFAAGKLAKEWGVSPKDVKKGACRYYTPETAAKIKKALP